MRNNLWLLLAVIAIPSSLFANTVYFPQVVFGGGYSTTFLLLNTGATPVVSRVSFYDQDGKSRTPLDRAVDIRPGGLLGSQFRTPDR